MTVPAELRINASTGDGHPVDAHLGPGALAWGMQAARTPPAATLRPAAVVGEERWRDPQHGWGVLLPMPTPEERWSAADLARARDQPRPLQDLIASRLRDDGGHPVLAPVLRYDPRWWPRALVRHLPDGGETLPAPCERFGLRSPNEVPRYLLIAADPEAVPWEVQYHLAQHHLVGRLHLPDDEALGNHVEALLTDFAGFAADPHLSTVWSTAVDDITRDMLATVADPLAERLGDDPHTGPGLEQLTGEGATGQALAASLARQPGLVVTTSHGRTGPLGVAHRPQMGAQLGVPVDQHDLPVGLDGWHGEGAVWYAHACCSAGARRHSDYAALIPAGTRVHEVLQGVAALGSVVASLPTALLGSPRPLRAFVGHVEPTFDWTLRSSLTGQPLTTQVVEALWTRLFQPYPVAWALDPYRRVVGRWYAAIDQAVEDFEAGDPQAREVRLRARLTALDRESLVVLGDPTACLPAL